MVLSRMTINWAIPSTARIHHRLVSLATRSAATSPPARSTVINVVIRTSVYVSAQW